MGGKTAYFELGKCANTAASAVCCVAAAEKAKKHSKATNAKTPER